MFTIVICLDFAKTPNATSQLEGSGLAFREKSKTICVISQQYLIFSNGTQYMQVVYNSNQHIYDTPFNENSAWDLSSAFCELSSIDKYSVIPINQLRGLQTFQTQFLPNHLILY